MRFTFTYFFYFTAILLLIYSCDEPESKDDKIFQENLNSFNNRMSKLDSTLALMEELQNEVDKVEKDKALGKISEAEANAKLNQINNSLGRELSRVSKTNPVNGLPTWAKQLGLTEPTGMILDGDFCQTTSENNKTEGFNSVMLVYNGEYNHAISQAGIIADKAGIPMSQAYKDALILSQEYDIESIKGASYMNFEIGSDNNPKYNISITVDDNGTLSINATDTDALIRELEDR